MTPKQPYLLRAMHEWMSDNALTPHIVVDARREGVRVPQQYVVDGRIVLNVSYEATQGLTLGNDAVSFQARFGGRPLEVHVPVAAVLGIYARENGQGMIFGEAGDDDGPGPDGDGGPGPQDGGPSSSGAGSGRGPRLKVVK